MQSSNMRDRLMRRSQQATAMSASPILGKQLANQEDAQAAEVNLDAAPFDCMLLEYCPHSDMFEMLKQVAYQEGGSQTFILG